jgi:ABC-type nitrate/sulfonate/bicarbonate transport system substrate-binding protein
MQMRRVTTFAVAVALMAGVVACGSDEEESAAPAGTGTNAAASAEGVRVAYASELDPNDIADSIGLKAVGAKVTNLTEDSQVIAGLSRGSLDVGNIDFTAAVQARAQGVKLKLIGIAQMKPEFVMVGQPAVKTLQDLSGKRFAYHEPGSLTEVLAKLLVEQKAPEIEDKIKWSALPESPRRAAAMMAKRIDATTLEELDVLTLQEKEPFNVLGRWSDLEGDAAAAYSTVWVTTEDYLSGNRDKVLALMEGIQAGYTKAYADKPAWLAAANENLRNVDEDMVGKAYDAYVGSKMYPVAGTPAITPESYAAASTFFESVGEFEKAPPDDLVDYDLVKEASGT